MALSESITTAPTEKPVQAVLATGGIIAGRGAVDHAAARR